MKNTNESKKRYIVLPLIALLFVAAAFLTLFFSLRGCGNDEPVSTFIGSDGHRIALYQNGETSDLGIVEKSPTSALTSSGSTTSFPVTDDPVTTGRTVKTYLVTFLDYSGVVVGTSAVEKGGTAIAPPDPVREGYIFTGWSGQLFNITASKTVTAKYTQIDSPNVFDLSLVVSENDFIVNLKIDGKVSIAGAQGVLTLPKELTSGKIVTGSGVYAEAYGQDIHFVFANPAGKNQTSDKELLSLSFDLFADLPDEIVLSLTISDAFDQSFQSVAYSVIGEHIRIR